ncbi:MAG: hypothetical protein V7L00_17960 [Nostoc sp.]|uniref:hypothetical protein n=1 Tax=Nostoc sp. TaxID=1180 RepID=UPI002FFD02AD
MIYPSHHYDLPLLGIDFLSFGQVKNLIVMDFQPLFQDEAYLKKYIHPLQTLHDLYPDLAQGLEMKFYDANQYFSKYLLYHVRLISYNSQIYAESPKTPPLCTSIPLRS